jgi:YVTN family beta-propeller protein
VADGNSNDVAVIDAASNTVLARIPVGVAPWGIAIASGTRPSLHRAE